MENENMSTEQDTVETETTVDTAQETVETPNSTEQDSANEAQEIKQAYVPFSKGKEKFVVNGKEVEWDFETAKRYAQKGYSGMEAFKKAAEVERKNKELYQQLYSLAQDNPEELVRIFNPKYQPHAKSAQPEQGGEVDPFEQKLDMELQRRLAPLQQKIEAYEIAEERKAIQSEMEAAVKTYPILNNKYHQTLLKTEYKAALQRGEQVTIDDVAFYLSRDLQEMRAQEQAQTKKTIEQKRKEAPVHVTPQNQGSKPKAMDIEDVKRIAGLIS